MEINKEPLENTPVKNLERLQLEYELIGFNNKGAEKLIDVVKGTTNRCKQFLRRCSHLIVSVRHHPQKG